MNIHVTYKAVLLYEILGAKVALETSLAGVDADMRISAFLPRESFATAVALVWALARVRSLMSLHGTLECCHIATHGAPQHRHLALRVQ